MPMPEKKCKKVSFSEDDAATLTQRYDATTVLTLLQEIAHYPHTKIDWNELMKRTSTGISNAREYQMLWRHLAYGGALPEIFEEGAQPLDDDSDIDCELETLPSVSAESASEATAYVKVMMASRTLSESTPSSSTIEAPLTISVPDCHSSRALNDSSQPSDLMGGTDIIFPVTVQRQTLPTVSSTDGIETKGLVGGTMASKRKRKAWSEEEDMQLRAAVQRWGEGNWATMAKGDNFPIKRSATQLAQRWSTLRKKDSSTNSGTILTSTQYTTAEQLATRHSLSLALDMPFKKLTAPGMTGPVRTSMSIKNEAKPFNTTSASIKNEVKPFNTTEVSRVRGSVPPQHPSQQALLGSGGSPAKSKLASEKSIAKCNSISDHGLKPTVFHSGAQTVSRSNTVSQFKIAQPKNAAGTVPVGSSLTKTSISAGLPSDQKDKHVTSLVDEVLVKQEVKISDPELKPTTVHSGAHTVSRSNNVSQFKVAQAKNAVVTVPVGSSLTKTSISAGLPSDQKDKHVTSVVDEVLLKQEVKISDRELKPDTVHSGAQTGSPSNTVSQFKVAHAKNAVDSAPVGSSLTKTSISAGELKPDTVHSGAQTGSPSNTVSQFKVAHAKNAVDSAPVGSSLTKTSISAGLPSDQKDKHITSVVDEVLLNQEVKISDRELKPDTVHSGAQTVSKSNTVSQFKVAQAKNAVDSVPVGSSLTKISTSAGLPSDQKDKHATSMVDEVLLKQEVNPTKDLRVSDPSSIPKGRVQEDEASTLTTQSQVNSDLDKGRLDIDNDKGMPSEKILEHKAVSQNPGGREEQGSVKNSNVTSKTEGTENENDNLNKGSQDLDQGKETNSINGSSNHQNMNDKDVNLPIQDECTQGLELKTVSSV